MNGLIELLKRRHEGVDITCPETGKDLRVTNWDLRYLYKEDTTSSKIERNQGVYCKHCENIHELDYVTVGP